MRCPGWSGRPRRRTLGRMSSSHPHSGRSILRSWSSRHQGWVGCNWNIGRASQLEVLFLQSPKGIRKMLGLTKGKATVQQQRPERPPEMRRGIVGRSSILQLYTFCANSRRKRKKVPNWVANSGISRMIMQVYPRYSPLTPSSLMTFLITSMGPL